MNAVLQWLVVALMVGWSLHVALRRLLPGVSHTVQRRLAALLGAAGATTLAARLQQEPLSSASCDNGCSGCDTGCSKPAAASPQPVQWRSPPSSGACH